MDEGTLAFDDPSTLSLPPGASATVSVTVSPPRQTTVRFALLDDPGTASLDAGFANTDAAGHASVRLTASNEATSFRLRASVGTAQTSRNVAIVGVGLASVQVVPIYAGTRTGAFSSWTLSARANTTCAALSASTSDGPLSVTVPATEVPLLSNVPVGPPLALLLRGGRSVSGCADVTGLFVGEHREVSLALSNVPLSLAKSSLSLDLFVAPAPTDWDPLVARWDARFRGAFLGGRSSVAGALLDAMSLRVVGANGVAFQQRRLERGWDDALIDAYAADGPDVLLDTWLPTALADLREAPGPIRGTLRAAIDPSAPPVFSPKTVLRLHPLEGDPVGLVDIAWQVDATDAFFVGGTLTFTPSRLLGRALGEAILSADEGALTPQDALVRAGRCGDVADILTASGPAIEGCDVACLTALCASAYDDMWDRSLRTDELSGTSAKLTFGATGHALSDPQAAVTGFDGTWRGSVTDSAAKETDLPAQLEGEAHAASLP